MKGRGSEVHPPNRFLSVQVEEELDQLEWDVEYLDQKQKIPTQYFVDSSRTIVSENSSPDISFRYSLNPYRGCLHGCSYCYARPYHEYLGLDAGLDFETKIFVKENAPELFQQFLSRKKWKPQTIVLSGVTDCYQPVERKLQLTRGCLEIATQFQQPIGLITKNSLIIRDLDLLQQLAAHNLVRVNISITTLDAELARKMEPRTSTPTARLQAVKQLADAGVPVNVMMAPVIPGLNDSEIPKLLEAVAEAGAISANYTLLRLPHSVRFVFTKWLEKHFPNVTEKVLSRLASCREASCRENQKGKAQFGKRMRGEGVLADQIAQTFKVFQKKWNLNHKIPPLDASLFHVPGRHHQKTLF